MNKALKIANFWPIDLIERFDLLDKLAISKTIAEEIVLWVFDDNSGIIYLKQDNQFYYRESCRGADYKPLDEFL